VVSIGQHTAQRAQQQAGGLERFPGKSDIATARGQALWSTPRAGRTLRPAVPKLREAPFWFDPNHRQRMAAVMQIASWPTQYEYAVVSGDWRYDLVRQGLTCQSDPPRRCRRRQQVLSK
jgi:hypothetical protein